MSDHPGSKLSFSNAALAEGLKLAREASGRSIKECSRLLGITTSRLRSYEDGKNIPSLPELESLAYIYNIPLPALLEPQTLSKYIHNPDEEQLKQLLDIRLRVIATHLQLARENSGKSYQELSKETAISPSRLKKYGGGEIAIPLNDLTALAEALDLDFENLLDHDSPIGIWQASLVKMQSFSELSGETQVFALSPENQPYISFVNRLREIGQEPLRHLADSIQIILDSFNP